ncbi:MAG: dihydroorotase [Xanthomonadales bacterium]|nr:dihydroorotase [Gammaproteobacteria bacterium]MBT8049571.1 dihydroorotase [Gammaproteobacteria bacterium]MBT8056537.1 dihydroorotase [Gammaproteobacteria bacterium]NNL05981.1 dihydroorotase [Xanthomonadales bacterium]
MTTELTITRPDDWHIHLRDGAALSGTVPSAARYFGRAIVMPNLTPPVTDAAMAAAYRGRIIAQRPKASAWQPLMVIYLTDRTSAKTVSEAGKAGVTAAKLYPAGATTNSDSGVTSIERIYPALEAMSELGMPLLVHGEVTRQGVDVFDRESRFVEEQLAPLVARFPLLSVVLEHVSTREAVDFVEQAGPRVAATITPQHLAYNRNDMLVGGVRPHFYCLPILKRDTHQQALREAVAGGSAKFFLGTDSAPHEQKTKETACGCAGCFTSHAALELYAEVFEQLGALDKLEAFASFHGPDFYDLPRNTDTITLRREPWEVPSSYSLGEGRVVPLCAGETLNWRVLQ